MTTPVEISVRSSLKKVIEELETIRAKADDTGSSFKSWGTNVTEELSNNVKRTETFLGGLRSLSRRVADQLRGDFKSLISVNALADAMKLSNQLRQSFDQTVQLSDTVRKLGATFGIAGKDFASFQTKMSEGLGDLGMDANVAAEALKGLSKTPVRGQQNLLAYSQTAGMLASIGGEKGREGEIAKGMADVIQARGGNVNDPTQMAKLAESLRRVFVQTGATPTETLRSMTEIFATMPQDLRKSITDAGLANLAAASQVGGPNATKFLEEYLGKSPIARLAFEAQGGKGVFNEKGLDVEKFKKFFADITGRIHGDPRLAAQTLGLSEEAAEGFIRMGENLDKVRSAQEKVATTTGSVNDQYRQSMGLAESFRANINKVKQLIAAPLSTLTQGATNAFSGASQSSMGAAAVVGGTAITAAMLTGLAMRGIGGALGGKIGGFAAGAARTEAAESIFGQKVVPVYVTNIDEVSSGIGSLLGAGGGAAAGAGGLSLMGLLGVGAMAGGAAYAVNEAFDAGEDEIKRGAGYKGDSTIFSAEQIAVLRKSFISGKVPDAQRDRVEKILTDYDTKNQVSKIMGPPAPGPSGRISGQSPGSAVGVPTQKVNIQVEVKSPTLKAHVEKPPRGASI